MSGIAGIVERDGSAVDPKLLQELAAGIAYRGPDAQDSWVGENAGLTRALLRTTPEAAQEPAITVHQHLRVVADARIDRRSELIGALKIPTNRMASDAELLAEAYLRWGTECVEHLRGDFAFAVWDAKRRELFCARDHFGVKPFYYAERGFRFLFSSDVTALRQSGISSELNDQALADFLMIGHNCVSDSTTFIAIRKLPAAHSMSVRADGVRIRCYWTLPRHDSIRYPRSEEYVDHYRSLLTQAVRDRLRTDRASILLSGGLDSTSIAATARRGVTEAERPELQGFTIVEDKLGEDPETKYARMAARELNIAHHVISRDQHEFFDGDEKLELLRPEPQENPFRQIQHEVFVRMQAVGRVMLDGTGGDLGLMASHADKPMSAAMAVQTLSAFVPLLLEHRRIPRLGFRTVLKKLRGVQPQQSSKEFPAFLSARALRGGGAERWRTYYSLDMDASRPAAYSALSDVQWPAYFERVDPVPPRYQIESRFPFFDVDLVTFVLALPDLPWFVEKHLLRRATRRWLPEEVRLRPKTWVVHNPITARKAAIDRLLAGFKPSYVIRELVNWEAITESLETNDGAYSDALRIVGLDLWLRAWGLTDS